MSRIHFFNRYVYPDHSATSQLLADVAFRLAGEGRAVTLVGSAQRYDDVTATLPLRERVDGVDIRRIGGSRFGRASLVGRAIDYLTYLIGAAFVLLRHVRRGDVVVLMTDPPMLGAVLGPLAGLRRARCIHWVQDLFPEVAEVLLGARWRGWRVAPVRWLRDRSLRRADRVVAISRGMATRLAGIGVDPARIEVIENWADDNAIQPHAPRENPLRAEWGMGGCFVVGYSGNLGRAHDWETMFRIAKALHHRDDIRFLLIGGGRGMQEFETAVRDAALSNVLFKSYQPRELLGSSLAVADVHWLSLLPSLGGLIFPSKLYGIMAAGRPALLVGDTSGELASTIGANGAGWTLRVGDVKAGVALIERLSADPDEVATSGAAARRYIESGRTRMSALSRWCDLLVPP